MDTPVDAQAVINHLTTQVGQLSYELAVQRALAEKLMNERDISSDKGPVHNITDMP